MKLNDIYFEEGRVVKLHSGIDGLRELMGIKVSKVEGDSDCLSMVASDATIDRYQEVIDQRGWDLSAYKGNPVIQDSHQYGSIACTIGTALSTEVKDGKLIQVWKFAASINPLAKLAKDMYAGGFLHASSVGFIPKKAEEGATGSGIRRVFTKSELLEVSAVGIPANPNALAMAYKAGAVEKSDIKEAYQLLSHLFGVEQKEEAAIFSESLFDAVNKAHKLTRK